MTNSRPAPAFGPPRGLGPEHPDVAQSLNNLAVLYHTQSKYAEAEPLYERSLAIKEKALGLYQAQGKYAEAEPHYQHASAADDELRFYRRCRIKEGMALSA